MISQIVEIDKDGALVIDKKQRIKIVLLGVTMDSLQSLQSRRWITKTCSDRQVVVELPRNQIDDKHGRRFAYVYLDDGPMLNEMLIEQGLAHCDATHRHALDKWFEVLQWRCSKRQAGNN